LKGGRTYNYRSRNNGVVLTDTSTSPKVYDYGVNGVVTYYPKTAVEARVFV
jgi:hypothetical protein